MGINKEKRDIININYNTLVTANPGTGKTLLLAYKYLDLVKNGTDTNNILCLTFTEKAKREMETRILKLLNEQNIPFDPVNVHVYTFHSFANSYIEAEDLISSNLLRYSVFKYVKKLDIFNYSDEYLLDTIVPKMENLIRYLKSFGILPDQIDMIATKDLLIPTKKYSKEEIDTYADAFHEIFIYYENLKKRKGIDYTDMLIEYLDLKKLPEFEYVLIDELQDVNKIEAEIALRSGNQFFAVGDKKQAIFGFQGGSILNFDMFNDSEQRVLSENFRSTNEILDYAREFFSIHTKDVQHERDLKYFRNKNASPGPEPIIYPLGRNEIVGGVCSLAEELSKDEGNVAIVTRTNQQIMRITNELKNRGLDFSSTFYSASNDAKGHIITFIKGIISNDLVDIKNSMLTPFFPISLQDAFRIFDEKDISLEGIYAICPEFKRLRGDVRTVEDVNVLFETKIIPISVSYGKEYLYSALSIQDAYNEALKVLDHPTIYELAVYMSSSDLLSSTSDVEKQITVTTVHKAKGKEFDTVIYVPSKSRNNENFQDDVVKAMLLTTGINATEELEEEDLRVDFVAMTRAKERLYIVAEKPEQYINDKAKLRDFDLDIPQTQLDLSERARRAYALFLNGEMEKSKELLNSNEAWIRDYLKSKLEDMERISFSKLRDNAYDFLHDILLGIESYNPAITFGKDIHTMAECILNGTEFEVSPRAKKCEDNIRTLINDIRIYYPDIVGTEEGFMVPVKKLLGIDTEIYFNGFIDAIFKNDNDEYLIVDWKSSRKKDSRYKQQLEAYRHAYSIVKEIPLDKVNVAVGYCSLRPNINTGCIEYTLDDNAPAKSAFKTFAKKVKKVLEWRNNIDLFFEDLMSKQSDDCLWKSVVEQYMKEKN